MNPLAHSRRQFLQFTGAAAVVAAGHRLVPAWFNAQAAAPAAQAVPPSLLGDLAFPEVARSHADALTVPEGFRAEVLLRRGDVLNPQGERYGDHNDFLTWLPRDERTAWLWCNHEDAQLELADGSWGATWTRERAAEFLRWQGGSAIRLERDRRGRWRPVLPHAENFRLDGLTTKIAFDGPAAGTLWVHGAREAIGTTSNCGGGLTPWGTVCTAEENFQETWGDPVLGTAPSQAAGFFPRPSEHYGYIVEVDLATRAAVKHTALGRFAHENVAFNTARDGRLVAYMGDDRNGECLYKYVSEERYEPAAGAANRRLLQRGTLYAADTERGRWRPLDPARTPALARAGFDRARICVHTRAAAKLAGATRLARPEDVEVHPETGEVYVALTAWQPGANDPRRPAYFKEAAGAIGALREAGGDAGAEEFDFRIFVPGGPDTGLAWPDNLAFTPERHLLVTTDFSVKPRPEPGGTQETFGNNFLVVVPTAGPAAGKVKRFAVAPRGAEFCSPTLSPDGEELWVNVQHPGGDSTAAEITSRWPDGGTSLPRSALVAIRRET